MRAVEIVAPDHLIDRSEQDYAERGNKYRPHQGERETARRRRQMAAGLIR